MVMFKLLDRKTDESSFYLNADGTKDLENKLDFTHSRGILNPFYIINENGARIYYRYIKGCPIYDPAEQDKQKIVANMQSMVVEFVKGAPIVLDEVKGKILIDWLDIHPFNVNSKYHEAGVHEAMFFKHDPAKEIKQELEDIGEADEAIDILRLLRKSPERMRSVALLFASTSFLPTDEEIYLGLRKVAMDNPRAFTNSIASKENEVLSDVLKALKYSIIAKDAKGYFYTADEKVLFATTEKEKVANGQLVIFLMSKEGDIHYRNLLVKIEQKEVELNAPK